MEIHFVNKILKKYNLEIVLAIPYFQDTVMCIGNDTRENQRSCKNKSYRTANKEEQQTVR